MYTILYCLNSLPCVTTYCNKQLIISGMENNTFIAVCKYFRYPELTNLKWASWEGKGSIAWSSWSTSNTGEQWIAGIGVFSIVPLLQVSQDFPFLHPSETSVLNRLCRLGTDYIRFTEFIEQYTGHVQQQVGACSQGMYTSRRRELCQAFSESMGNSCEVILKKLWISHHWNYSSEGQVTTSKKGKIYTFLFVKKRVKPEKVFGTW